MRKSRGDKIKDLVHAVRKPFLLAKATRGDRSRRGKGMKR